MKTKIHKRFIKLRPIVLILFLISSFNVFGQDDTPTEKPDIEVKVEGKFCIKRDNKGNTEISIKGKIKASFNVVDKALKKVGGTIKKGFKQGFKWIKGRFSKTGEINYPPRDNTNQFAVSVMVNGLNQTLILTPNIIMDTPGTYGDIDFVFEVDSVDFPLINVNDTVILEFVFELEDITTGEVTFVTQQVDITVEECLIQNIPTLSQWGLILLTLLLFSLSTVTLIRQRQSSLQAAGTMTYSSPLPLLDRTVFKRILLKSIPLIIAAFLIISFWEGSFLLRNLVGTLLSGGIIAYVVHFILLSDSDS